MKKLTILFILGLFCFSCGKSEIGQQTQNKLINAELLATAKNLVYKPNPTNDDLKEAQLIIAKIPTDAPEYADGQELVKYINQKIGVSSMENQKPVKVEIGMSYSEVQKICGDGRDFSNYESKNKTIFSETRDFESGEKADKGCYGRFTYINHELESVSR